MCNWKKKKILKIIRKNKWKCAKKCHQSWIIVSAIEVKKNSKKMFSSDNIWSFHIFASFMSAFTSTFLRAETSTRKLLLQYSHRAFKALNIFSTCLVYSSSEPNRYGIYIQYICPIAKCEVWILATKYWNIDQYSVYVAYIMRCALNKSNINFFPNYWETWINVFLQLINWIFSKCAI